jgi:hypothetical protein
MKKLCLLILLGGLLNIGVSKAAEKDPSPNPDKANTNKLTHNKLLRKTGQGISHGFYALTHNKLTKVININDGNTKYKHREDV